MGKRVGGTGATYKDGRRVEVVLSGGMGEGAKFSPGAGVECRGCRGASPSRPVPAWLFHTHCASPVRADISLPCCCPGHTYPAALAEILGVLYNCLRRAGLRLPRPTSLLQPSILRWCWPAWRQLKPALQDRQNQHLWFLRPRASLRPVRI